MTDKVTLDAQVPEADGGERLDVVASRLFIDYSRARLQAWIKSGALTVNGERRRPRDKVLAGDRLSVNAELSPQVAWRGQAIALDIIHEDDSILVLNKPAGLVVHPAAGHADGTLVNALLHHVPSQDALPRAGVVHRLDKETSGVMVVAKSLPAHADLVAQLQARSVSRDYYAICVGALTGGGTVDAAIGRHPRMRKKMAVVTVGGKPAITHYRVKRRFAHHTLVAVSLETGRTHQIRVHMAHRHHPLVGDPLYGGRLRLPPAASSALAECLRGFKRQALHAYRLGLIHPQTGEQLYFQCDLPEDMLNLLNTLEQEDNPVAHHSQ